MAAAATTEATRASICAFYKKGGASPRRDAPPRGRVEVRVRGPRPFYFLAVFVEAGVTVTVCACFWPLVSVYFTRTCDPVSLDSCVAWIALPCWVIWVAGPIMTDSDCVDVLIVSVCPSTFSSVPASE